MNSNSFKEIFTKVINNRQKHKTMFAMFVSLHYLRT